MTIVAVLLLIAIVIAYIYYAYAPAPGIPKLSSEIKQDSIQSGNRNRTFLSYAPAGMPANSPLIIALHGTGMNGEKMRQWTGYEFDQLADERQFAVVYPDGYKGNWNDCRKDAPFPAKKENIDDVTFIIDLINKFEKDTQIDPRRIFLFGFSNGGQMVLRLITEIPEHFSAGVAIGANFPTQETCSCSFEGHTSRLMLVAGTADPISPYIGGDVKLFNIKKIGTVISAPATAENIVKRNDIQVAPITYTLTHQNRRDITTVDCTSWVIDDTPRIQLFKINGGGHVIPQQKYRFPRLMGKTSGDLDAVKAALDFFKITKKLK